VEHHIHGRKVPNFDAPYNRCWICPSCHDETHSNRPNRIVIIGWFKTTGGRQLIWYRADEGPPKDFEDYDPAEPYLW
jgi:hypothetical protein